MGNTEIQNISARLRSAGFEKILEFRKGDTSSARNLSVGTGYIAHAIGWTKCWLSSSEDEVVERKIYRVALGERPPEREDLGDLERTIGPRALTAKRLIPRACDTFSRWRKLGWRSLIFTTSSFGGRRAVADLCAAYASADEKRKPRPADRQAGSSGHANQRVRPGATASIRDRRLDHPADDFDDAIGRALGRRARRIDPF